jgi:hypothetical protein
MIMGCIFFKVCTEYLNTIKKSLISNGLLKLHVTRKCKTLCGVCFVCVFMYI